MAPEAAADGSRRLQPPADPDARFELPARRHRAREPPAPPGPDRDRPGHGRRFVAPGATRRQRQPDPEARGQPGAPDPVGDRVPPVHGKPDRPGTAQTGRVLALRLETGRAHDRRRADRRREGRRDRAGRPPRPAALHGRRHLPRRARPRARSAAGRLRVRAHRSRSHRRGAGTREATRSGSSRVQRLQARRAGPRSPSG